MIRVSNEKNFITSNAQSSKIPMEEMPLINYVIELFTASLLNNLRQGLYSSYTKETKNSSYVRGNILVSKTIQNNFIDKSKVYISYNKHSSNNLLMQIFKTLAKILLQDKNLSYSAKQNLHEIYLLLDGVDIINLQSEDFQRVVFNRLNDKYEILFNQANFIFNKYMPFSSQINATPFWSILFDMDYLFEKFVAYLFRKSDIKFIEQNVTNCFSDKNKIVSIRPDFVIENNIDLFDKKTICVIDAKWKLLSSDKSLYGLNSQNFWQMFSYMNLINEQEQINGYFIVPKNSNKFEDEINFEPIIEKNKSINILSIDFSLKFEDIVKNYRYKIQNNKFEVDYQVSDVYQDKRIFAKPMNLENIKQFEFIGFIADKTIIYLKKLDDIYQYFSTDSNLEEFLYFKPAIFKNSLENRIGNFLKLHRQKTLYFSSIDIKNKLFSDIVEFSLYNERNNVITTSTDYNSKISMNLRSNEFFHFAIDFYDSFDNKIKNLYYDNETTMNQLINNFYTSKDKHKTYSEINEYKDKLKQENKIQNTKKYFDLDQTSIDVASNSSFIPLKEEELELYYSENEDKILQLANNKDLRDEFKIILFYRKYENIEFKEKIQNIILTNSSKDLQKLLGISIKEITSQFEKKYKYFSTKYENWVYGFIYCNNNDYIYSIKEAIAHNTTSKEIINILSDEVKERKIMYAILENEYHIDNNYIVTHEILKKIYEYAVEQENIKMVLKILERKEVSLKLVQDIVKIFGHKDIIPLIKKTNYQDKAIQNWVNEIDSFNLDNYLNLSIDNKIDFAIEAHFQYYDNDFIKKLCYETDYDILGEMLADKHNTLAVRFIFLIYLLNYKDYNFKEKHLVPAVKHKKNDMLTHIIDLHENNDIRNVTKYIEENFNKIDNEILFGYAMSNNQEVYHIRAKICLLTNDLNLLDEFSKNKNDENILISIMNHHRGNPDFIEKIKGNKSKYSVSTLDRISKYDEYYKYNDNTCLIAKIANNFNLNVATRYYLFNKYKNDKVILEALNNQSLDFDYNLKEFKNLLIKTLNSMTVKESATFNLEQYIENNNDLSEDIKSDSKEKANLIFCTDCKLEKEKEKFSQRLHKKNDYKTGVCKDCENLRTRERSKEFNPLLIYRYNSLKKNAKKEGKILNFTHEEFKNFLLNDGVFEELYNEWIDSEENGERDKNLKPNCYLVDENLDYDLNNIKIASTQEVLKIHTENLVNGKFSKPVVQLTNNGDIKKIYSSMQEAERQNEEYGFKNGAICVCCQENNKRSANQKQRKHQGYIWKYKADVSQELIHNFELNASNQNKSVQKVSMISKENDETIKDLLIELRNEIVHKEFNINSKTSILSDEMIEQFILYKPRNIGEFKLKIPIKYRENIESKEMQFIDRIFEILEMTDE